MKKMIHTAVLADLGYGLDPKTRAERADAFFYKHAAWMSVMPSQTANTLAAIVAQFGKAGTDGLESPDIFNTPEVRTAGGKDIALGSIARRTHLKQPEDGVVQVIVARLLCSSLAQARKLHTETVCGLRRHPPDHGHFELLSWRNGIGQTMQI